MASKGGHWKGGRFIRASGSSGGGGGGGGGGGRFQQNFRRISRGLKDADINYIRDASSFRSDSFATVRDLLRTIWTEPRMTGCPARLRCFAYAGQRRGTDWIELRDDEDLPILVFTSDPVGFDGYYVEEESVAGEMTNLSFGAANGSSCTLTSHPHSEATFLTNSHSLGRK